MLIVTSYADFGLYLKFFDSLIRYIKCLEEQVTKVVTNSSHNFMEGNFLKVI